MKIAHLNSSLQAQKQFPKTSPSRGTATAPLPLKIQGQERKESYLCTGEESLSLHVWGFLFSSLFFFLKLTSDKKIKMINAQEWPCHPSRQSPFKKGSLGNPTDLYYVRIKVAEWQFWTLSISDSLTLSHLLLVAHSSELHFNFSQ